MAYVDWSIKGPELSTCSCDWGCPCQFNELPSKRYCRAAVAMRIDEGHFGDVRLDGTRAHLRAVNVPARQFVELRTLFPRRAFASTAGMRVEDGAGLQKIVAEERADAEEFERDQEQIDELLAHPGRTALVVLGLATAPALLVIAGIWWFLGRERRTAYDREYEQEPPTETEPALVPTLLRQGGEAGSFEFTATLFDLVRRGHYSAEQVTTERSIWGGLRSQTISDLEISAGTPYTRLIAPAGSPASAKQRISSAGEAGVSSGALTMIEQPAASAADTFRTT